MCDFIRARYLELCRTPSDINEHLPTLRELASKCNVIGEFGVRTPTSTFALLDGLIESMRTNPGRKKLYCVDLEKSPDIESIKIAALKAGIEFEFIQGNDLNIDIPEKMDLAFFDTWHVFGHLIRELAKHAHNTKTYIALHDTEIDAIHGETIRNYWNPIQQSKDTGIPVEEITKGLRPAVAQFLEKGDSQGGKWTLIAHYTNNNGLSVLQRVK